MATEAELMESRARTIAAIKAKGGKDAAPNLTARLNDIDRQLSGMRGGAAGAPNPLKSVPKGTIKGTKQGLKADVAGADYAATHQIPLTNPTVNGPLGSTTTTVGPDGKPVVTQTLDPKQQYTLDQDTQISQLGRHLGDMRLRDPGNDYGRTWHPNQAPRSLYASGGPGAFANPNGERSVNPTGGRGEFSSPLGARGVDGMGRRDTFNPTLTARTGTGDLVADRRRIEDDVYGNLTRFTDRDKSREWDDTEQTLYNRGTPLDPRNPLYAKSRQGLDERYDSIKMDAAQKATMMGGDEYSRSFDIGEAARQHDYDIQSRTRGINTAEEQGRFGNQEGMRDMDYLQGLSTHQQGMGDFGQRFRQQEEARVTDYGQRLGVHQQGMADFGQRVGIQEGQRGTDFSQQLVGRQQGFSETSALAGFGTGVQMPNFQPFQAPSYQVTPPSAVSAGIDQIKTGNAAIAANKTIAAGNNATAIQIAAMNRARGGGAAQSEPDYFG